MNLPQAHGSISGLHLRALETLDGEPQGSILLGSLPQVRPTAPACSGAFTLLTLLFLPAT